MIDWTSLLGLMGGNKKPAGAMPMVQQKNGMADFSEYLKGGTPTGAAPAQKTPWLNREGMGGLSKGELLMAGMGMLSGKNMQQGFSNAGPILYGGMERKRADQEKQQKSAALTKAMGLMGTDPAAAKMAMLEAYPDATGEAMAAQVFAGPQKPTVVNGRVIDPNDPTKVIADYSDGEDMNLPSGMFMNPETGQPEYLPGYIDGQRQIAEARGSNANNVQSTFTGADGTQYIVRRDGSMEPLGVKARNPFQITDVGGVPTAIDRLTGQGTQVTSPETVGTNAATIATIKGNEGARQEAQQGLPLAIEKADRSIATIESLVNHPGFDQAYGLASYVPAIRGTDRAGADALREQIGGQAFLEAFQSLKGGGQITEIEGQKATAAITRLSNPGISPAEARKAAQEFTEIIRRGTERAKATASGSYAPQGADAPALKYNPATGEFE